MKRNKREVQYHKKNLRTKFHIPERQRWILFPVITLVSLIIIGTILIVILSRNLPSLTELERYDPLLVTRIYSADGKLLKELYKQNRIQVPLDRMPENLIHAVIATEDRRFWNHWGLDLRRIVKAAIVDILTMSKQQGAGTITGQLARKLYLTSQKSWTRKIREALTVLQIERTYSKSEILEMYLNHMWFGHGAYGVQAAAQRYFKKNVEDLTTEESALLVGILQRPAKYSPINHPKAALRRRNTVLQCMVSCGYLSQTEADSLGRLGLGIVTKNDESKTIAPYFCEYVRQLMEKKYGLRLYTDGLSIYTTLDTRVQACADSAVNAFMPSLDKKIRRRILKNQSFTKWFNPPLETPQEIHAFLSDSVLVDSLFRVKATPQVALVALDPNNGHILAMIGGRDFNASKFNRAVQAKRQPGSAFKPIVYTTAIDNGYPPDTELLNQPVVLIMPDGTRWSPQNYDHSTGGPTTLREALRRSLNLVTVRLVQELVPPKKVVAYAKQFGLTTTIHPYDAVALGSDVVIPIELTSAFSVFANKGVRVEPIAVLRVEDKNGNILEQTIPKRHEVISEQTAYIMTDMLRTVINKGTGQAARSRYHFYRPAGGKTGTTNDFTDAWFIGFTPQITAGVWVGFDDPTMSLGDKQTGAATALPIWAPFMRMVYDTLKLPLVDFTQPPGIVRLKICSESKKIATDLCPKVWDEVFTKEMAPTDTCDIHRGPGRNLKYGKKKKRIIF